MVIGGRPACHAPHEQGVEISPERKIAYDSLVISVGSQCNDFGTSGVKEHCAFLDSRDQAEKLHKMILSRYLGAHASDQPKPLSIAVVGAGATGVELSAELHHAVRLIKGRHSPGIVGYPQDLLDRGLRAHSPCPSRTD